MAERSPRRCRNCSKIFDNTVPRRRKYCDDECRDKYLKAIKLANKADIDAIPSHNAVTPYVKAMRKLAFENLEDDVREVLREETRKQVSLHLKDNILGATEALTALLPAVLAGLATDVDHEDWMRRSRAQALVMKYAFAHKDDPAQTEDRMNINIFHGVPIPDSPFGDRMIERQQDIIEGELEERTIMATSLDPNADPNEVIELPREVFEEFWPVCRSCREHKHPETFAKLSEDQTRGQCRTCEYAQGVRATFRSELKVAPGMPIQHIANETADWDTKEYGPEG